MSNNEEGNGHPPKFQDGPPAAAPEQPPSVPSEGGDPNEPSVNSSCLPQHVTALKRKIQTLQKMLIVVAVRKYGFDNRARRNTATRKIADDLLLAGVPLDEETILAHLREATELLPPED